ncbi:hypothetical protein TWF718_009025 [Orbilia javanica]|uniref:Uncharacterized protein n=1 Tax=Orbilia javanica TaxID=47235 RepID=A0AAN8MLM5_9PEZI
MVHSPLRTWDLDRMYHSSQSAILIFVIITATFTSYTNGACYFPDGSQSSDQPCDTSASNSMCCAVGTSCLMNGVCHSFTTVNQEYVSTYARGSCTDQSWGSSACINECIYEGTYDQWGPLIPCSNNFDAFFCYFQEGNNDGEHCEERSDVFTLFGGNSIRTTIGVGVTTEISTLRSIEISTEISTEVSIETSIRTSIATVFVTPSPSPSPTPNPPSVDTPPQNTRPNNIPESRTTTNASPTPTNISEPASSSNSGPNPVVIGGAVGGSVGAICLLLIAYLAYLLGKRRQADKMTPSQPMWQLPPDTGQAYRRYPTDMAMLPMAVHRPPPAPVPPTPAFTPAAIPPPPLGGLPPGYTPYNPQLFGPPLT